MFDPMQVYYVSAHTPTQGYRNLDDEQFAQRYGHAVIVRRSPWSRVSLRVGKLLIHIGEKLAAENTQIELGKETL
ncbi:MAG: hypothetical protein WA821_16800 [Anaerolineales bacterium]